MVRVEAYSRLHFGLLSFAAPTLASSDEVPHRQFGGVGLMIQSPGTVLTVRPAASWSANGALAERALAFAKRFATFHSPEMAHPQQIGVERAAPEHVGLGTGTQLGLAMAHALATSWGLPTLDATALAPMIGRGRRSALGIHGFERGGFLVEAGKRDLDSISPLISRSDFPEQWRVVLVIPPWKQGLHGPAEMEVFRRIDREGVEPENTNRLCKLIVMGLLPTLAEQDIDAFGSALYEFNRLAGEVFAADQGGFYAGSRLDELVQFLRRQGVCGVAQSSWGPTVCAVVADDDKAEDLVRRVRKEFSLHPTEAYATNACNHGAKVEN